MASGLTRTAPWRGWWSGLKRAETSTMVAMLLAPLLALTLAAPASAQVVATAGPSVMVSGVGRASAPAASATVQLLLGLGEGEFGFSRTESGSGGYESASASASAEAEARAGGRRDRERRAAPQAITPEQIEAIATAVAEAAGVERDAIQTTASPLEARRGEGRGRNVRLDLGDAGRGGRGERQHLRCLCRALPA